MIILLSQIYKRNFNVYIFVNQYYDHIMNTGLTQ